MMTDLKRVLVAAALVANPSFALIEPSTSIVPINGYLPVTDVSHQMALSLDMKMMMHLVKANDFEKAKEVYLKGGYSLTRAELTIEGGLPFPLPEGTKLSGTTNDGKTVVGTVPHNTLEGATVLKFVYPAIGDETDYYKCNVGGLPDEDINTKGCLTPNGELKGDDQTTISYTYTVHTDTVNGRTLASLSTHDNKRMRPGEDQPYFTSFQPFVEYYGTYDYANQIVMAGFEASDTDLAIDNFKLASKEEDTGARQAVIEEGTAALSVGMNVLRELEYAVYQCHQCKGPNGDDCDHEESAINAVDQAVAFYVGSEDNFFHYLANLRCRLFGTCREADGEAFVNINIFEYFNELQSFIQDGDCQEARRMTDLITKQMWIPMIQGNLRMAWMLSDENPNAYITSSGHQARGAIYAASILPIIYECNPTSAEVIHQNMRVRETGIVDAFTAVKEAFESCYEYLGITCEEVGGKMDPETREYDSPLTRPCVDSASSGTSGNGGKVFGILILVLGILVALAAVGYWYFNRHKTDVVKEAPEQPLPEQPLPASKKEDAELV